MSDDTLEFDKVADGPFTIHQLRDDDVMLINTGAKIFVSVGQGAPLKEKAAAMMKAQGLISKLGMPKETHICRVMVGQAISDPCWHACFPQSRTPAPLIQKQATKAQRSAVAPGQNRGAEGEGRGGIIQIHRPGDEGRRARPGVHPSVDRKGAGGEGGEGAAAMQKGTEYAVGDSNVENIGSAEDRAARLGAAMTELAWSGAGEVPGIEVWRVHNKRTEKDNPDFGIERVPRAEYRQFYRGDSYIVLYTYKMPDNEALLYNVHFWIGANSTQDEYGVAAYKTVELDDLLGDVPIQYREMEGSESELFLSYFQPGGVCAGAIEILEGGHASGFRHVKPEEYGPRLMWVRKEGSQMLSSELPLELSSLNQGDCFILDSGNTLYIYQGESSSLFEKNKAINVATGMKQQRSEQSKVVSP